MAFQLEAAFSYNHAIELNTSAAMLHVSLLEYAMVDKSKGVVPDQDISAKGDAALPEDFETALTQLETLVAQMENGTLALDQSLQAYERGVQLARVCQSRLDHAEQQVKVLQGNLLKPLDAAADINED